MSCHWARPVEALQAEQETNDVNGWNKLKKNDRMIVV
jgi:hypothetical protein